MLFRKYLCKGWSFIYFEVFWSMLKHFEHRALPYKHWFCILSESKHWFKHIGARGSIFEAFWSILKICCAFWRFFTLRRFLTMFDAFWRFFYAFVCILRINFIGFGCTLRISSMKFWCKIRENLWNLLVNYAYFCGNRTRFHAFRVILPDGCRMILTPYW